MRSVLFGRPLFTAPLVVRGRVRRREAGPPSRRKRAGLGPASRRRRGDLTDGRGRSRHRRGGQGHRERDAVAGRVLDRGVPSPSPGTFAPDANSPGGGDMQVGGRRWGMAKCRPGNGVRERPSTWDLQYGAGYFLRSDPWEKRRTAPGKEGRGCAQVLLKGPTKPGTSRTSPGEGDDPGRGPPPGNGSPAKAQPQGGLLGRRKIRQAKKKAGVGGPGSRSREARRPHSLRNSNSKFEGAMRSGLPCAAVRRARADGGAGQAETFPVRAH